MRRYKRGYPVATLIGLEKNKTTLWRIFSEVAKPQSTIHLHGTRNNPKALYDFHESIINALRPTLKEGVRSVILASPTKTTYDQEFIDHIKEHHKWLTKGHNKAAFSTIIGIASTPTQVATLTRTQLFHNLMSKTTAEETENLVEILEKRLSASDRNGFVLFSLDETESLIVKKNKSKRPKPEYLLLTNRYFVESSEKNRLQRIIQIATNRRVKTRIIDSESPAGKRLSQLGGFVCLPKIE